MELLPTIIVTVLLTVGFERFLEIASDRLETRFIAKRKAKNIAKFWDWYLKN